MPSIALPIEAPKNCNQLTSMWAMAGLPQQRRFGGDGAWLVDRVKWRPFKPTSGIRLRS